MGCHNSKGKIVIKSHGAEDATSHHSTGDTRAVFLPARLLF